MKIQNVVLPKHTLPTFIKRHPLTNTRCVTGEDAYGCIIMDTAFVGASSETHRSRVAHGGWPFGARRVNAKPEIDRWDLRREFVTRDP